MPYAFRDGNNDPRTMASAGDGSNPALGDIPEYNRYGTTGTDHSSHPATVPADSNNSALITIPVNADRALVYVQNQSAAVLQIVRDDGVGNNQTSIFLAQMFSTWESSTFKGRIVVYGPTGAQIGAFED